MRAKSVGFWNRKLHRHGSVFLALPLLVVICSGLLLLLKKDVDWIQPPTTHGAGSDPSIGFDEILSAARTVPEARVESWADVDRLDVRPNRGIVKVRARSGFEVQIDTSTGEVLQALRRRSDLIESIHDGTWFHDRVKLWLFLPCGLILLFLWCTGMYLWFKPVLAGRRRVVAGQRATLIASSSTGGSGRREPNVRTAATSVSCAGLESEPRDRL